MPVMAMLRNLGKMDKIGMFAQSASGISTELVLGYLGNKEIMKESK